MNEFLILSFLLLLGVAVLLATLREIRNDGYGHTAPPASHHADLLGPVPRGR
ncbi:MAG TPA: hypothetical protein VFG72_05535 [Marmoricola sp.]|nr:hypothetical protein [Marmoricola sp.]